MEVHHHPHVEKKNFKEYFFEFLMIFLAVTMGFFAGTLRESFSDSHKNHQFAKSLIQDINTDIRNCDTVVSFMEGKVKSYDSLLLCLASLNSTWANKTYYHFCRSREYNNFLPDNKTIDQLKSTGDLRLFEKDNAPDTIASYYQASSALADYSSTYMKIIFDYNNIAMHLFDYSQVGEMVSNPKKLLDSALRLKFLDSDINLAKRTYNELFILRRITLAYIYETKDLKNQGISCVSFLKKEYDIAD